MLRILCLTIKKHKQRDTKWEHKTSLFAAPRFVFRRMSISAKCDVRNGNRLTLCRRWCFISECNAVITTLMSQMSRDGTPTRIEHYARWWHKLIIPCVNFYIIFSSGKAFYRLVDPLNNLLIKKLNSSSKWEFTWEHRNVLLRAVLFGSVPTHRINSSTGMGFIINYASLNCLASNSEVDGERKIKLNSEHSQPIGYVSS